VRSWVDGTYPDEIIDLTKQFSSVMPAMPLISGRQLEKKSVSGLLLAARNNMEARQRTPYQR